MNYKLETTKGSIAQNFHNIVSIKEDLVDYLFKLGEPVAFTAKDGMFEADVYVLFDIAFIVGEEPYGNIVPDDEVVKIYEKEAERMYYESENDRYRKTSWLDLIDSFIDEVVVD